MNRIDPQRAWQPYQPSKENPWDERSAAHLFRRAGFCGSKEELQAAVAQDPQDVVAELVEQSSEPSEFRREVDALVRAGLASGSVPQLAAQWVYRMLRTPSPLLEKTTLFWHGHFATSAAKVADAELMQQQNSLLREYALGDFSKLLLEISRDPAMLIYLDSVSNRKSHPNENYAREIMELFCLGEGNYSETDIRELARCFTGWEIKRKKFRFNRYQHDNGSKNILGKEGIFGGEQAVEIVAEQDAAPQFIAYKLVRYFVADEVSADDPLLHPLAEQLRADALDIAPTVQRILGSEYFFSAASRARKIRSPIDLAVGFLRALDGSTDNYQVAQGCGELGQSLYYPPSVKGWDGGRTWINSSTLLGRSNLIRQILDSDKTRFGRTGLEEYLQSKDIRSARELAQWIEPLLFAVPIPAAAIDQVDQIDSSEKNREKALKDTLHVLCTLPEFQLA